MKKILSLLLVTLLAFESAAQDTNTLSLQQDLMKKSNTQYKAGWIFLGSGLALSLSSIVIPNRYDYVDDSSNERFLSILGWTGFLSISTSLPLFLSAGRNARMAAKLSLENQSLNQPNIGNGLPKTYPALSLKIPL